LNTWKGRKKDERRSRLFGTGPKEEEILVDHAAGEFTKPEQANGLILGIGGGEEEEFPIHVG
jgi:hypothetical protein